MERGWVKLHRKIADNIFLMKDDKAFLLFSKLLLFANSKGQIGMSGRELAEKAHMNHSTLYKVLKRLEMETMIKQDSKHAYTLISICNWDTYQDTSKHYGKHMVNTQQTHGKRLTGVARIENKELRKGLDFVEEKTTDQARAKRETAERIRQELVSKGILK